MMNWMRAFSIRLRMRGAIGMVLALFALVGVTAVLGGRHMAALNESFMSASIDETHAVGELRRALGDVRRHEKDMVIDYEDSTAVAKHRELWTQAIDHTKKEFARLLEGPEDLDNAHARSAGKDETADLLRELAHMQHQLSALVGQVRKASDNIHTASNEVASGNADLSARTEQTASNLQQAASSMEQLTGTVKHSADAATQASQMAGSASEVARRGGEVVGQVVATMDEINHASRRIGDIIGVIDGIAFQTNILALNAAVEAARAGEQGRGFAVVAGEVRSLAGRSAEAAREIKALISASVEKVESGSRQVQDAGQTMNEIVASVQRVTDIIREISAAASEQSQGIGQVNASVGHLDQMTQQNAALVEQSAAAA
jgi:methyl-accepting chemotaxis protein